jgi:hypothetical protein
MKEEKTHYRKAFNSPYLSSADIVAPTILTIAYVRLEIDKSKKSKDQFNTAYFKEKEIRTGEKLKPMILNACNSRTMAGRTKSKFIDDWIDTPVTIYVDNNVRFGSDTVEGLRISPEPPRLTKPELTPKSPGWNRAIEVYKQEGSFDRVETKMIVSDANKDLIRQAAEINDVA